jgi:hypothetical protein
VDDLAVAGAIAIAIAIAIAGLACVANCFDGQWMI